MSIISSNIKFLRNRKGISQTALAEAVDLKRGNIASYEKELAQPNIENIVKLADYFKVDINQLVKTDLTKGNPLDSKPSGNFTGEKIFQGIKERVVAFKATGDQHEKILHLKTQNEDIYKMVAGFRAYHHHRMKSTDHHSETVRKIASDYENIIDLLETVLNSNKELIKLLDK